MIEEPPSAAKLDFACRDAVLKVPEHRGDELVVAGVEIVDDCLGQAAREVESVEVLGKGCSYWQVADGIESTIRAEYFFHPGVVVSDRPVMDLHGPAFRRIHHREFVKQIGFVAQRLINRHGTTRARLGENR